jgi:hypothetical protein
MLLAWTSSPAEARIVSTRSAEMPGRLGFSQFAEVPIDAALAWVDVDSLPMLRTLRLDGVLIDGTRKIVKHAARPGPLSIAEIDQLAALLEDELPPRRERSARN